MKKFISIRLFRFLGLLPFSLSHSLALVVSWLMRIIGARAWHTTRRNLELCFPNMNRDERLQLAIKSLNNSCTTGVEAFLIWRRSWAQLQPCIVNVNGEELLHKALDDKRSLIILGLHHGNWELCCKYLATKNSDIVFLYKPNKNVIFDDFMLEARTEQDKINWQPATRKGVMAVIKQLRTGGTINILPDQIPDEINSGAFVPFFGMPAFFMTMVHKLYKRTNAQILIAYAHRTAEGFKIEIQEPDKLIYNSAQQQSLLGLSRNIETIIKQSPEQYQWGYKRFRVRPDTDSDLYDC